MGYLFPAAVYSLCFLTSAACAWLLGRSYARSRARLLLWSSLCFGILAVNNLFLVADMVVFPNIDFRLTRALLLLAAVVVIVFGFVWDQEDS